MTRFIFSALLTVQLTQKQSFDRLDMKKSEIIVSNEMKIMEKGKKKSKKTKK